MLFRYFWTGAGPSELPALILIAVAIVAQRKASFGRKQVLIYALALLQLALPALIFVFAAVFSHERGVILTARSTESRLGYLLLGLFLLQYPVGLLLVFFLTSQIRSTKYQVIIGTILAALLMMQLYYSFTLMFAASLELSGDSF
jgi:hypothetical protein